MLHVHIELQLFLLPPRISPFCSLAGARSHTPVMAKADILKPLQARRRSAESRRRYYAG